ncbi:MAG: helix-turn-helix domain-containing protein [Jatrophihabitans sp.]
MTENDTDVHTWTAQQLLFTAEEAARALNVGRTTLYALIKDGQLHSVHIGRSCRLTRAALLSYVTRLDAASLGPVLRRHHRTLTNPDGLFGLDPTPPDAA